MSNFVGGTIVSPPLGGLNVGGGNRLYLCFLFILEFFSISEFFSTCPRLRA